MIPGDVGDVGWFLRWVLHFSAILGVWLFVGGYMSRVW